MKAYVCDSCDKPIINPYEANMREFYYGVEYDFAYYFPIALKRREKIHLCGNCFKNLKNIAVRKDGRKAE